MKKHKTSDIIKDMLLEMIINSAIIFEQDSMDFYCNAVEKAHEPESRNLLVMLMREEENHI